MSSHSAKHQQRAHILAAKVLLYVAIKCCTQSIRVSVFSQNRNAVENSNLLETQCRTRVNGPITGVVIVTE